MINAVSAPNKPIVITFLLGVVGLIFIAGGGQLLLVGGSVYYLISGFLILGAGVALWRRRVTGLWLYALFMLITLCWSVYESGLDGWALTPRLFVPAGFGIWLTFPHIRRWLAGQNTAVVASQSCGLLSVLSVILVLAAAFMSGKPSGHFPAASQAASSAKFVGTEDGQWQHYGNTRGGTRFSPLTQITTDNIDQLEPAWTYRTGVVQEGEQSHMQSTPLMVNDSLYFCTQTNVVISLNPETGVEKWRYDPRVDPTGGSLVRTCRGVAYVETPTSPDCPRRIITATFDTRLLAINADSGELCQSFGSQGVVDLKRGMGKLDPGFSYMSSAPLVVRDNVVINGWIADNVRVGEPSGVIRAFNVVTGAFSWAWDMGRPGEYGEPASGESYTRGTPNSWGPMSGDEDLGMVYVPTGNATPDHWGGHRDEVMDKYSTSVVALDSETGEPQWHFQAVHHDLWDYDIGSQPTLTDIEIDGKTVPSLLQPTKSGQLFMLDRRTGELLADVEERPVPGNPAAGDRVSPTQPFSTEMPTFSTETLRERDMWGITPFDQLWCRIHFRQMRYEGQYTPISSEQFTLVYPGVGGGMNWGGISVDPIHGVALVNSLHIGSIIKLIPREEGAGAGGATKYHIGGGPQEGTPFSFVWNTFISPLNVPCNEPPFGKMSAVDLRNKKLLWSVPMGTARDNGPFGLQFGLPFTMGMPNFGGSVTTAGGLVFIGATQEKVLRAYDIRSGDLVWKHRLPAGGMANPMTYISPESGRQFVVTIAGGHRTLQSPLGDYVQAFALPETVFNAIKDQE